MVEWQGLLTHAADESAQRRYSSCELLDTLDVFRLLHRHDGSDFLRVRLDPSLRDEVSKQLTRWDAKSALFRIEFDPVAIEVVERLAEIVDKCPCLTSFYDYVINIDLNVATDLVLEACLHASLVRGTCVL